MDFRQNAALIGVFIMLGIMSIWLQFGLLETPETEISEAEKNDPDYYILDFVSTGMDELGKQYQVIADRMVHYPYGDRALLDRPHIVQFELDGTPRHIYADSGWLYNEGSRVLLTGNVRVIQSHTKNVGGVATAEKMLIHLKERG